MSAEDYAGPLGENPAEFLAGLRRDLPPRTAAEDRRDYAALLAEMFGDMRTDFLAESRRDSVARPGEASAEVAAIYLGGLGGNYGAGSIEFPAT